MVKAVVGGNKNNAADARAIWTAVQQPGIKAVAVKSEGQQAVLALHRMRAQWVKSRTAQRSATRSRAPGTSRRILEIAAVLELSTMTVKRSWKSARAFLLKELQG